MSKVTIQEVARQAGVSKGTVSRVLNGRNEVNSLTRSHVLEVVKRLEYVPDPGARKLARMGRHQIGLAFSNGESSYGPYYTVLLDALQERFMNEGYTVRNLTPGPDGLPSENVDGLVLLDVHLDDPRPAKLEVRKQAFVMVGHERANTAWVDIDNVFGLLEVMRHLVQLGHERIAHLSGASSGHAAMQRREGYVQGLVAAGLTVDQRLIWDGEFSQLGGYRAVRRALGERLEFSAIACASDEMALGAMAALEDAGLRVPWDVSVTGFDDLPLAQRHVPALTTVHQPIRTVARTAAELLLERMAGKPLKSTLIPTCLVVRASSGARLNR
jgi:LacI family transcriptional regulator